MLSHNTNWALAATFCLVWIVMASHAAPACALDDRPNIVLIFTDDQGWNDISCYGSEIPTPNIDSLAAEGLKFNQFYAASSICTPSRFGLLTGRYSIRSRDHLNSALMFLDDADAQRGIHPGETTYVNLLQESGYRTALVGKWHLGHGDNRFWPTNHGFESFFGHTGGCVDFFTLHYGSQPDWYRNHELVEPGSYATDAITDEAIRFLKEQSSADRPFYLHLAYNAPHYGKASDAVDGAAINVMQPKPDDLARVPASIEDANRRAFAAKVMGLDQSIGRILETLRQIAVADNTLVIFMTDHGADPDYGGSNLPLRGGKATLFEGGLRVPCLVRWPAKIPAGLQTDVVACGVDCFPTLCFVAGIDATQYSLDGLNLVPLITEAAAATSSRELFWHTGAHQALNRNDWSALRVGNLKLVRAPNQPDQLFDLSVDPLERKDLAGSFPEELARLSSRLNELLSSAEPH
ncbi:MAG: sulfatase-like hydrolase/transferase [Planctomycetales bacterium]|nr:sulfatase-like hydrolase/transferase [Planctomycetales bacterium]